MNNNIDWKPLTDCRYYMTGYCSNNESCLFRHSEVSKNSKFICQNWQNYNCFDIKCQNKHIDQYQSNTYISEVKTTSMSEEKVDDNIVIPICKFHLRNKCSHGLSCRFSHGNFNSSSEIINEDIIENNKRKAEDILSNYSFKSSLKKLDKNSYKN